MYKVIFNFLSEDERNKLLALANTLVWEAGRQETGYQKAAVPAGFGDGLKEILVERSFNALGWSDKNEYFTTGHFPPHDCYILKYPIDSFIPPHKDDAPFGSEHWRLNAIISSGDGGLLQLNCRNVELGYGDAVIFRPDQLMHSVSKIKRGERYVWSFGTLK